MKVRGGTVDGPGIALLMIAGLRARGNGNAMAVACIMVMRRALIGVGWHFVSIAFKVAGCTRDDLSAIHRLGGVRGAACPEHQDEH